MPPYPVVVVVTCVLFFERWLRLHLALVAVLVHWLCWLISVGSSSTDRLIIAGFLQRVGDWLRFGYLRPFKIENDDDDDDDDVNYLR